MRRAALLWLALAGTAGAEVEAVPYGELAAAPHLRVGFDDLPAVPEPGHRLDAPLRYPGVWIGAALAGQRIVAAQTGTGRFDRLTGVPALPLRTAADVSGQNLAVAQHRGFGSNALFALGPDGFAALSGRGEGTATVLFDTDQIGFGLKIHADYADPLGLRPEPGRVWLRFLDRAGDVVARAEVTLRPGVLTLGWQSRVPFAAVQIETDDPGGIALDDLLIPREVPGS